MISDMKVYKMFLCLHQKLFSFINYYYILATGFIEQTILMIFTTIHTSTSSLALRRWQQLDPLTKVYN